MNVTSGSHLNLRKSPSISSSVIGKLYAGQTVDVESTANNWAYVKMKDGLEGYASAEYLKPKY
ncbi:SH3 domain-containing protein [Vibrio neptunius]|uniref:SH3 domain-containing protein n=1 Tax=Vibrio neptunius TaxID=170651 RepID=UPI003B972DD1